DGAQLRPLPPRPSGPLPPASLDRELTAAGTGSGGAYGSDRQIPHRCPAPVDRCRPERPVGHRGSSGETGAVARSTSADGHVRIGGLPPIDRNRLVKSVTASVLALYFLLLLEYGIWRGALIAAGLGATAALLASVCGMRRSGFRVTRRRWSRPRWRHLTRAGRVILPVVTAGYA